MTSKPMPRAVLIDLDGTLADTLQILYGIFGKFLGDLGTEGTREEFMRLNGSTFDEIIVDLKQKYGWKESHDQLTEKYMDLLKSEYSTQAKPFPGVIDFLVYVRQKGLKVALVTSAEDFFADRFLEVNDLDQYFDFVVAGSHASKSKPDPEIYYIALEALSLQPDQALAIEDSPRGIQSAKNAGIDVIPFGGEHKDWKSVLNYFIEVYG